MFHCFLERQHEQTKQLDKLTNFVQKLGEELKILNFQLAASGITTATKLPVQLPLATISEFNLLEEQLCEVEHV